MDNFQSNGENALKMYMTSSFGSYSECFTVKTHLTYLRMMLFVMMLMLISGLSFGQRNETEKEWIQSYKELVYYNGLLKGLNNSALSKALVKTDNSFYNPVFTILHQKAIEQGGNYLLELIRKDSLDRYGRVSEAKCRFHFKEAK